MPVEVCEERDPKGLYKKAREGVIQEFTGVSAPYEEPDGAEIHIRNVELSVEAAVAQVMRYLQEEGLLKRLRE